MSKLNVVLYADDDIDDREIMYDAFSRYSDMHMITFPSGIELYEFLLSHRNEVCAVLLDMNMPYRTGLEVLQDIRQQPSFHELPVCIYTTASNPLAKQSIDLYNAMTFTKPSSISGIEKVVEQIVSYCKSLNS